VNERRASLLPLPRFITVDEFAEIARLSRRQIDRLRTRRPAGFPREYELGSGKSKHGRCPRFKLDDVLAWMESRALW
jgi:predicted DNA-binding transcriptional regulator AlpA